MIIDAYHLACQIGHKPRSVAYICLNIDEHVTSFTSKKRQGDKIKIRRIYAPDEKLKNIQRKICTGILSKYSIHDCAHGFVSGRGTLSNASAHYGRSTIVNVDLKNFFPSISSSRVYDFWITRVINPVVAFMLTRLTTYAGHLSQGFVTSPTISNVMMFDADTQIDQFAMSRGMIYTRYADDITLSTDKRVSASEIVSEVTKIVSSHGLEVNRLKTRVMRPSRRQEVTGLIVNETKDHQKPRLPRAERRMIRAMCHKGIMADKEKEAERSGWLSYLKSIDPALHLKMMEILEYRSRETGQHQEGM